MNIPKLSSTKEIDFNFIEAHSYFFLYNKMYKIMRATDEVRYCKFCHFYGGVKEGITCGNISPRVCCDYYFVLMPSIELLLKEIEN